MNIFTNIADEKFIESLNSFGHNVYLGTNFFTDFTDKSAPEIEKYDKFILSPTDLAYLTAALTLTDKDIYVLGHFPYPSQRIICIPNIEALYRVFEPPKDIRPFLVALSSIVYNNVEPDEKGNYIVSNDDVKYFSENFSLNVTPLKDCIVFNFNSKGK